MKIGVLPMRPESLLVGVAALSLVIWPGRAEAGETTFGPQQVITTSARTAFSVFAADLDGDGDMDVLSASSDPNVAWYENTDGMGSFGPQQVITTSADGAAAAIAADLDGDGDLDVLRREKESMIRWTKGYAESIRTRLAVNTSGKEA